MNDVSDSSTTAEKPEALGALERIALVLSLVLVALLAARDVDTPDIGFHLRAGEYLLEGNGWLRTDPFSFTMNDHEYIAGSWAYEVAAALVQRAAGPAGIVLMHVVFLTAAFAVLWRTLRLTPRMSALALPLFLLAILASEMRFSARPEALSYLLLALLAHLLHRRDAGKRAPLWLMPVLFVVWVNCHSLFILGWGLLACCLVGKFLGDLRVDWPLLGWSAASIAACLINPYGLEGVLVPRTLLTRFDADSPFRQDILEYGSPFDTAMLDASVYFAWLPMWSFRIFAALALVSVFGLLRLNRWWCAVAILLFTWPATRMIKNMPILVVIGLAPALWGLSVPHFLRAPRLRRAAALAVVVTALVLCLRVRTDAYYAATRRWERSGLGWNTWVLPVDAVNYVRDAKLGGRGLNHLNVGGWLMWAGRVPVFIDGRLEVVGEEFFAEHQRAFSSMEGLEDCVRRWDIDWMLLPWFFAPELMAQLSVDPRWTLVYADAVAVLFVRARDDEVARPSPELAALLEPRPFEILDLPGFAEGVPRASPTATWIGGLFRRQRFPRDEHLLGRFHLERGEGALAAAHYAAGIRASEGVFVELYDGLGLSLVLMERWRDARDCFRIVLAERPGDRTTLRRLESLETKLAGER